MGSCSGVSGSGSGSGSALSVQVERSPTPMSAKAERRTGLSEQANSPPCTIRATSDQLLTRTALVSAKVPIPWDRPNLVRAELGCR